MSTDLTLLVWPVGLALVQSDIAVLGAQMQVGLPALAGSRETLPPLTSSADRAARAHRNMVENLVLVAALVLVAQVSVKANGMTALGSELFFWARLVYVPVFLIGIPWVRTVVWAVSVVGLVLIFIELL